LKFELVNLDYVPHDDKTITEMLKVIGVNNLEELFQDIPKDLSKE
jgi:glycine cleavage system pyridoxal-binding protein P